MNRSVFVIVAAVLVLIVAAATFFGDADERRGGPPLDPQSTIDDGSAAAWILVEQTGRSIEIGEFDPGSATNVLVDPVALDQPGIDRVQTYVESGGQVVLLDPDERLVELAGAGTLDDDLACDVEGFTDVDSLTTGVARAIASPAGAQSCFEVADGWLVVSAPMGTGRLVAVGSSRPFMNQWLAADDNAAFVVGVVGLTEGPITVVATERFAAIGAGDLTLMELISPVAWSVVAMVLVVLAFYALTRSRRLGNPVDETDLVEIDATELTKATARLYERSKARSVGTTRMYSLLDDDLGRRWRIDPREAGAEAVATKVRALPGERPLLKEALDPRAPEDDAGYVRRIGALVQARRIVTGSKRKEIQEERSPT
ncbi:MAG: DUF4350 domain-containing protein [Acidimicrobiales bacterium]|nr:hypothetical protein [Acidimicrobiales bacterium]